jgi:hypothetical protein
MVYLYRSLGDLKFLLEEATTKSSMSTEIRVLPSSAAFDPIIPIISRLHHHVMFLRGQPQHRASGRRPAV